MKKGLIYVIVFILLSSLANAWWFGPVLPPPTIYPIVTAVGTVLNEMNHFLRVGSNATGVDGDENRTIT